MINRREDEYRRRNRESVNREYEHQQNSRENEKQKEQEQKPAAKEEPVSVTTPDFELEEGNLLGISII